MTGTIRRVMSNGYGFIVPDGTRESVFFHAKDLRLGVNFDSLQPGMRVDYDVGVDLRSGREQAIAVRLLDATSA
jgi:cold shock CspA family protein